MRSTKGPRDFLTTAEINQLGTAPDSIVARKLGRSVAAIERARLRRNIPSHRELVVASRWKKMDRKLGKMPDTKIARALGISSEAVLKRRRKLGIDAMS